MRGAVARRPMPPLMVRGGVERGETEGIRKPGNETGRVETTAFFRGSEIEQTIPQSATLTAPFAQGSHGKGRRAPPNSTPCCLFCREVMRENISVGQNARSRSQLHPQVSFGFDYAKQKHTRKGCALFWSGKRDLNPRHLPWQGNALPLSYSRICRISAC